jgi:hypothetical protein
MINTFQFLSKKLNSNTLLKIHSITKNNIFKNHVIKKLGFFPISLNSLVNQSLINFKDFFSIYCQNDIIHIFNNNNEAIHFYIIKKNNITNLNIYLSEFRHLSSLMSLINNFKTLFIEFYLDTCLINYSSNYIILYKLMILKLLKFIY